MNLIKRFCKRWAKWVVIYRRENPSLLEVFVDGKSGANLTQVFTESQLVFRNWVYDSKSEVHYELPESIPAGSIAVVRYTYHKEVIMEDQNGIYTEEYAELNRIFERLKAMVYMVGDECVEEVFGVNGWSESEQEFAQEFAWENGVIGFNCYRQTVWLNVEGVDIFVYNYPQVQRYGKWVQYLNHQLPRICNEVEKQREALDSERERKEEELRQLRLSPIDDGWLFDELGKKKED